MVWESAEYSYSGSMSNDGTPIIRNAAAVASVATSGTITTTNSSGLHFAGCATAALCTVGAGLTARNDLASCDYNGSTCTSTNNDMSSTGGVLLEDRFNTASGSKTVTFGITGGATDLTTVAFMAF
jgi:hypothetical protein